MPKPLLLVMALSCLVYTVFCMHLPVALLADAPNDDGLFVQHGLTIISGHWLGPYSQMTLAKGPGYPLFLALNAELGVPITLSQALLYCAACLLVGRAIYRLAGAPWLTLFCFLAIQWHPALFPSRIIRDDISAPQVLLVLAAIWHCLFIPGGFRHRLLWAAFGGLILGWFWLTREDAIWVVPGLLITLVFQALRLLRRGREMLRVGGCALAFLVTMMATLGLVAVINLHVYGTFATTDFSSATFESAVNTLQSVHVGEPVPFVPVPAKVRRAIDQVSPAFASLEPYFNGPGRDWTKFGCALYPSSCGDFAGGWFVWALRDAAAAMGHYSSPKAAARFYLQIARQVGAACASDRLNCVSNPIPFMPAVTRSQWGRLPSELLKMYQIATWQPVVAERDLESHFPNSTGNPTQLTTMERFLRYPRRTNSASEVGVAAQGRTAVELLGLLDLVYSHLLSAGTIVSVLVLCFTILWRLIRRQRAWLDAVVILILSLWTLLLARAAVLVLVDLSSFPAINPLYWSPGFPLLCLAIILALALPFLRFETPSGAR